MKNGTFYALTIVASFVTMGLVANMADNPIGTQTPSERPAQAYKAEIDKNVYQASSRAFYPKTFDQWGESWVKRIDKIRVKAAERAAQSSECDRVEASELSDRSKIKSKIEVFVDCRNSTRFYFSESDFQEKQEATPPESKQSKLASIDDWQALTLCKEEIPSLLQFPSSFDPHEIVGSSVYRAPTGNIVVNLDLDAMNGLGATLPFTARCVIDDRGLHTPEISAR